MEEEKVLCNWNHENCFGHEDLGSGYCGCLTDTDFPGRKDCPFYKSLSQHLEEQEGMK